MKETKSQLAAAIKQFGKLVYNNHRVIQMLYVFIQMVYVFMIALM